MSTAHRSDAIWRVKPMHKPSEDPTSTPGTLPTSKNVAVTHQHQVPRVHELTHKKYLPNAVALPRAGVMHELSSVQAPLLHPLHCRSIPCSDHECVFAPIIVTVQGKRVWSIRSVVRRCCVGGGLLIPCHLGCASDVVDGYVLRSTGGARIVLRCAIRAIVRGALATSNVQIAVRRCRRFRSVRSHLRTENSQLAIVFWLMTVDVPLMRDCRNFDSRPCSCGISDYRMRALLTTRPKHIHSPPQCSKERTQQITFTQRDTSIQPKSDCQMTREHTNSSKPNGPLKVCCDSNQKVASHKFVQR
eukprot:m.1375997 g.1375997  ORF g.1375997 m.1375997 type:complete len:302 (-) comp24962_c1_seq11:130-1035(-)